MRTLPTASLAAFAVLLAAAPRGALAQQGDHHEDHAPPPPSTAPQTRAATSDAVPHSMWMRPIGDGWAVMGMAQLFPVVTAASDRQERSLLGTAGLYATQPAVMLNVASPRSRLVLRTTLNFEELTQENGELTYGGWGEGFIDSRHPHTLLHEAMLTANWWDTGGGVLSISAGKGFAPYGTDDPMGRPALKFPTNHHLSQVLERWTLNVAWLRGGWGLEGGLFGGAEPEDAYDLSNIERFGDSWSARLSRRFGAARGSDGFGPFAPWELSASYARIMEEHHGTALRTELYNAAARHDADYAFGRLYALAEASRSEPQRGEGHWSVLGEALLALGDGRRHAPYARLEYATRPEYEREGTPGTPGFFRYDHDAHEIGATRWLIATVGYGFETSAYPVSVRPFVEVQRNRVTAERGGIDPRALYGSRHFWSVSAGARLFLGGGPMRMGSYGALDPMTAAMRPSLQERGGHHGHD
ncbi:MAG TPA: hypothetical protein VFZ11_14950 [Gemmatimonadaceae bacterium]